MLEDGIRAICQSLAPELSKQWLNLNHQEAGGGFCVVPRGGTADRTHGLWHWASLTSNVMETNERDEVICGPCRGNRASLYAQPAGCQFGTWRCPVFCVVRHWGVIAHGIHGVPHVTTLFTVFSLDVCYVVLGEYLIQHV